MLPDWIHRETREVAVLVDYEVDGHDDFVVLPASNSWMTVMELQTRPGGMRETFNGMQRRVHVPARTRHLQVLCRLKLYSRRDRSGHTVPWPTAAELFPGAHRIRQAAGHEDFGDFGDFGDFQEQQE